MLSDAYSTAESDGNKYFLGSRFLLPESVGYQDLVIAIVKADSTAYPQNWAYVEKYGNSLSSSYSTNMCIGNPAFCYPCKAYDPLCIWGWIDHFRNMVSGAQFQTDEGTLVAFDQSVLSAIAQYQSQVNKSYSQMNNTADINAILQIIHPPAPTPLPPPQPTGTGTSSTGTSPGTTTIPVVGQVPTNYLYYGGAAVAAYLLFFRKR